MASKAVVTRSSVLKLLEMCRTGVLITASRQLFTPTLSFSPISCSALLSGTPGYLQDSFCACSDACSSLIAGCLIVLPSGRVRFPDLGTTSLGLSSPVCGCRASCIQGRWQTQTTREILFRFFTGWTLLMCSMTGSLESLLCSGLHKGLNSSRSREGGVPQTNLLYIALDKSTFQINKINPHR